jgi:hypothetical protein
MVIWALVKYVIRDGLKDDLTIPLMFFKTEQAAYRALEAISSDTDNDCDYDAVAYSVND